MSKKFLSMLLILIMMVATMTVGCQQNDKESNSITLTYGDKKLTIEAAPKSGYTLQSIGSDGYSVYKDGSKCAESTFITEEEYDKYASTVHGTEGCRIIGVGEVKGVVYMFYEYKNDNNLQYNRIVYIPDDVHMLLQCYADEETSKDIFYNLTFSIK